MSRYVSEKEFKKCLAYVAEHPEDVEKLSNSLDNGCPYVEIPDKHGALVEKTEITREMVHLINDKGEHFLALKVEDYNNLPVILEASE